MRGGPRTQEGAGRNLAKSTLGPGLAADGKTYSAGTNVWAEYCDLLGADRLPKTVGA